MPRMTVLQAAKQRSLIRDNHELNSITDTLMLLLGDLLNERYEQEELVPVLQDLAQAAKEVHDLIRDR